MPNIVNFPYLILAISLLFALFIDYKYKNKVTQKLRVLGRSENIFNRFSYLITFFTGKILEYFSFFVPFNSLRCKIHSLRGIKIGKNVYVGEQVIFDRVYPSLISIGNNSSIGDRCIITAHSGAALPMKNNKWSFLEKVEKVSIGSNVWIMPNVTIGPGVNIGDNVVVNTGAILTKDIPEGSIVTSSSPRYSKLPKQFSK